MATSIGNLAVIISGNTAGLTASLKAAQDRLSRFGDSVNNATSNMTSGLAGIAATIGSAVAAGLGLAGVAGVKLAADFEVTTLAFESLLGSASLAKSTLAELTAFADNTSFGSTEIYSAAKQLTAYGTATSQLLPQIKLLGDVSLAIGQPLGELTYIYGTLQTQGRAFAKDIYQFTNRGVPLLDELARVMHVTKGEVMGLVEEGKVGFNEVNSALKNLTSNAGALAGVDLRGMLAAQMKFDPVTLNREFSTATAGLKPDLAFAGRIADAVAKLDLEGPLKGKLVKGLAAEAKVGEAELLDLVRTGKVATADLARAFDRLGADKGRFAGMTAKLEGSLSQLWGQVTDKGTRVLIDLGQMLIDEFDLKGAVNGLIKFVETLRDNLDTLRPVLRFVGDAGRAAFHAIQYVVRDLAESLRVLWIGLEEATPGAIAMLKDFAAEVQAFFRNFLLLKNDFAGTQTEMVAGLATIGRWVLYGVEAVKYLIDAFSRLRVSGPGVFGVLADGAETAFGVLAVAAEAAGTIIYKGILAGVKGIASALAEHLVRPAVESFRAVTESASAALGLLAVLPGSGALAGLLKAQVDTTNAQFDEMIKKADAAKAAFAPDGAFDELGRVAADATDEIGAKLSGLAKRSATAFGLMDEGVKSWGDRMAGVDATIDGFVGRMIKRLQQGNTAAHQTAAALSALGAAGPLQALTGLAQTQGGKGGKGGKQVIGEVEIAPKGIGDDLLAKAKELTKAFGVDPVRAFQKELDDLDALRLNKLIDEKTFGLGLDKLLGEKEKALGIGEFKAPTAVVANTSQAVSAEARFQMQASVETNPQARSENLLRQLLEEARRWGRIAEANRSTQDRAARRPTS